MRHSWAWALFFAAIALNDGLFADPPNCQCCQGPFLARVKPAGGYFPYGGGLVHWWNPCCSHCGFPDDYCRKPLPNVCWAACPACYSHEPLSLRGNDTSHTVRGAASPGQPQGTSMPPPY